MRLRLCTGVILAVWLVVGSASAQKDSAKPSSESTTRAIQELEAWRKSQEPVLRNDFGQLARYREANSRLKPPAPGENRVVFLGDSITDAWPLEQYFPGKPYLNRGIGGQTTPQMLVRFREDVVDLQPKAVLILAGTNDIAGNTGPMSLDEIESNYASMAELARAHDIHVIFASVTPVNDYRRTASDFFALRPPEKILALNRWLKKYCADNGFTYVDYFSAMIDNRGLLKKELSSDGLHPNPAGYKIMAPLAEHAIEQTTSPPGR